MDNNDAYAVEDEMGVGDYATPEEAVSAEYEYYVQGHNPDAEGFNPTEMAREASHASIERLMRHSGHGASYDPAHLLRPCEPDSDVPDAIKFDATRHPIGSEGEIVPDKQAEAQQDVREHAGSAVSVRESEARGDVDVSGLKENGGNDSVEFSQ